MLAKQLQLGEDDAYLALVQAWENALKALSADITKLSFESWVKPIVPLSFEDSTIVLGTPSRFAKNWIENKCISQIKTLLEKELGQGITVVLRYTDSNKQTVLDEPVRPTKKERKKVVDEPVSVPLNPRYSFDTFLVGASNRLAHATAEAISVLPGHTYNPFFLYGMAGLGKTHLMHAIGLAIKQNHPNLRVAYVRGETFTSQYISSLREHKINDFRRRYRNVDVWLVDDVQFLVGKEKTEEEFFHTYNALHDGGKQVVLSSDRAPKDLELDGRLLSRFECGMVADIVAPDLETRVAILQEKAARENLVLPDDVSMYVAKIIRSNIRQLEGALIKLHAYAALMKAPITTELAEEVLGSYFVDADKALPLDPRLVQLAVSRHFGIDTDEIVGKRRNKEIVIARQVAMYLSRELTCASLPAIGRAFGGKDHTTVLHSVQKVQKLIETDTELKNKVDLISKELKSGSEPDN